MRGLILNDINERLRPQVNATRTGTYDKNEIVDVVGTEPGDEVDANDLWYRLNNGNYLWSGGVRVHLNSFDLPKLDRMQFMLCYRKVESGRPREDSKSAPDKLYFTPLFLPADNDNISVTHWDKDLFSSIVMNSLREIPPHRKHVFVYIHGYQLQLLNSLKIDLLSSFVSGYMFKEQNTIAKLIYFSWPSQSGPQRETVDDRSIALGENFTASGYFDYFKVLSENLRATGRTLNLVVHSFGHQLLNGMINPLPDLSGLTGKIFDHVFLMAPDITHLAAELNGSDVPNKVGKPNPVCYNLSPLNELAGSVHIFHDKFDYLLYSSTVRFGRDSNAKDMLQYRNLGNYGNTFLTNPDPAFKWYDVQKLTNSLSSPDLWDYPFQQLKEKFVNDIGKIWPDQQTVPPAIADYSGIKGLKIFAHQGLFEDHHRYLFTSEPIVDEVLKILG